MEDGGDEEEVMENRMEGEIGRLRTYKRFSLVAAV